MTGTKIDTIKIRQLNREQTFEYIKKNPMAARADVAKELNLSFPTGPVSLQSWKKQD